ncbi:DNA polymerase III subunit gamma/tau [Thalassotalea sp. 1_MG-2023]|uniref:DNA polymerase III subunit gamma/tau n=1 Tax=Thalassotalea sp. 1_MG-2023 TaxID=3062680 RepID=UPI0026E2DF21|nr:DNA polymerase III subunit gamma/tau [Thalassotalea sp. 1_MG-2023]MDO6428013.1 DNA polymerase III subunit gamma/tau [Thalassotalea sp. 1_MG-2023]
MSYQVLARKWRPKNFAQLMGQEHVVAVLSNALQQQRLHHAYLFTGTRGVGKTTIARIFAKSLNCAQGVTAQPCGQCDVCEDIDLGRFVDLIEIDAASRTKVDDTREILDNVQYAPTRGRYKVYLIDEVHMLSRSSFNALLKTLEEPPEHVKFILATTDPQKLPITVLSRCLQFHLKALTVKQIEQKLSEILQSEKVTIEPLALNLLAKAARGSMRDSLSLTDQAIAQGNGEIIAANVQQMLGGVDHNWVFKILIALIKNDSKALMNLSLEIASYSPNYGRLLAELIQLLHQVAITQVVGKHFDLSPEHNTLVEKFCQAMSPEDVQLYYQIALSGRKDLPYAADEQAAFDMVLLRLLAFKPQTHAELPSMTDAIENKVSFDDIRFSEAELSIDAKPVASKAENTEKTFQQVESPAEESDIVENDTVNEEALTAQMTELELTAASVREETIPEDSSNDYSVQKDRTIVEQPEALNESNTIDDEHTFDNQQSESSTEASNTLSATTNDELGKVATPEIAQVLARRNMLRSQKQALENTEKKFDDAETRQEPTAAANAIKNNIKQVPDIETLPEQPFIEQAIDPSIIKKANQVDKWANMIDAMALNGRLRQLALNATINENTNEESLVLSLNQSTKHLKSDAAMTQLNQFVSEYFGKTTTVEVVIVDETNDDPAQIQQKINDKRYEYAKALLKEDDLVIAMQETFQAELNEDTIEAR